MKKGIISLLCTVFLAGSLGTVSYASPQKPFDWQGYVNSYAFDWNENTTVEMKNGDGTDVMSVNGQYIIDHMLPSSSWPALMDDGSLPSNVKTVSCQVVKEDAYLIMPFDGYVTIGLEDKDVASEYATICVRAKAGDKVNMVPRNLVLSYEPSYEWEKYYAGTTANDWTYNLRIYKEELVPLCPSEWRESLWWGRNGSVVSADILPDELISRPLYSGVGDYACLWFIYQVDAPNTNIAAIPYDAQLNHKAYFPGNQFTGWMPDPRIPGRWTYFWSGQHVANWLASSPTITVEIYEAGKLTIKDQDLYIEDRKVTTWTGYGSGVWIEPQYNIVNVS